MIERVLPIEVDLSKPKLFIAGITGIAGNAVKTVAQEQGFTTITPSRQDLDLVRISDGELERSISLNSPGVFINCTLARVTTDEAEKERENYDGIVWQTNTVVPEKIARVCKKYGILFIHLSTDYVLGGSLEKCPHKEDEEPSPISWYAISKVESERKVLEVGGKTHIVRIQRPFTYSPEAKKGDILRDAYKTIREGRKYFGIMDQCFSPGLDLDLARAVLEIAKCSEYGIWHVSSPTITTPYETVSLALFKLAELGVSLDRDLLERTNFADFPKHWRDIRPQHPAFDVSKFEKHFGKGILRSLPEAVEEWAKGFVANLHNRSLRE